MRVTFKNVVSSLLLIGGGYLLFLGGRDFVESRWGQSEAAREFERPVPDAVETRSVVKPSAPPQNHPGDTLAKLRIPRLDAELYVVEGDGPKELRRGPGHLAGTALPGEQGNCIIAGHRDTHFRVLKDIRQGDDIILQTSAGQFLYRVKTLKVVEPENTDPLKPTSTAELNLITCYPFYYVGSAPRRFVVEAQLKGAIQRPS